MIDFIYSEFFNSSSIHTEKFENNMQHLLEKELKFTGKVLCILPTIQLKSRLIKNKLPFLKTDTAYKPLANPVFAEINSLKYKIFLTDKILLKETKRNFALYKSLSKETKAELKIESYFDIIDLANDFFNFYKMKNLSDFNKNNNFLEDISLNKKEKSNKTISANKNIEISYNRIQRDQIQIFNKMKLEFDKFSSDWNSIPSDWIESKEFLNIIFFKQFDKIIFLDIIDFPVYYKNIFKELKDSLEIKIILQLNKGQFDEENLKLKDSISFKDNIGLKENPPKIEVFKVSSDNEELLSLVYLLNNLNIEILDSNDLKKENLKSNDFIKGNFIKDNFKKDNLKRDNFKEDNLKEKDLEILDLKNKDLKSEDLKSENLKFEVYGNQNSNKIYHEIFPDYFTKNRGSVLNETSIYKFIEIQLNLLLKQDFTKNKTIQIFAIKNAFENIVFRNYYDLHRHDIETLNMIIEDEYKFISKDILAKKEFEKYFVSSFNSDLLKKLNKILDDLFYIDTFKKSDDIFLYFTKNINLNLFIQPEFNSVFTRFFETLNLLKTTEKIVFFNNFEEFFPKNLGRSLYKLFFKYLDNITIKSNYQIDRNKFIIQNMDYFYLPSKYDKNEKFKNIKIIMDVDSQHLTMKINKNSFFTDSQKKILGIKTIDEENNDNKYRFLQGIANSNEIIFLAKENLDNNIFFSSILEELILDLDLKVKNTRLSSMDITTIFANWFISKKLDIIHKRSDFIKEDSDFKNGSINLGFYDFATLNNCPRKYYFKILSNLKESSSPIEERGLSPRFLGVLVHTIMEEIINSLDKIENIYDDKFIKDLISQKVNLIFNYSTLKINSFLKNYVNNLVIPLLINNILRFFKSITSDYSGNISEFQSEKRISKIFNDSNISLKGRIDLLLKTLDNNKNIIDFKTGNPTPNQGNFYSYILSDDTEDSQSFSYNLWAYKKDTKKYKLSNADIEDVINSFIQSHLYEIAKKASFCTDCEYIKICDRNVSNGGVYE